MIKLRILIGVLLLSCAPISAQQSDATLTGRLLDPNDTPAANTGSSLDATNTATGTKYSAVVSVNGDFRLTGLPPGTYDISVPIRSATYSSFNQKGVALKAGENRIDLHVGWSTNLGTVADDPIILANAMRARNKAVDGPTPRMRDGKPDFNGMWVRIVEPLGVPANPFPYQPWAAEVDKKLREFGGDNRPNVFCLPTTALSFNDPWFPHKIVQTSTLLLDLAEFNTPGYRQIFLDGRPHPDPTRWNPAWSGHSIGTWDGDTLVVDTVGFNEMAGGVGVHTEKLHVVERLRRPDLAHLNVDMTVEDADAYTRPWNQSVSFQLAPNEEILEFVCAENNKDLLRFRSGYKHRP